MLPHVFPSHAVDHVEDASLTRLESLGDQRMSQAALLSKSANGEDFGFGQFPVTTACSFHEDLVTQE